MYSNDPLGKALVDYENNFLDNDIIVHSDLCEDDLMKISYFFRTYEQMPPIEKKALDLCKGTVLDVGAGAGCHSKYLKINHTITAIDTSKGAVKHLTKNKINSVNIDFLNFTTGKFDTILMLMNGIGIAGKLNKLSTFLNHAKSLLNQGGQILCDSTDIQYLYEDEDGGKWVDLNSRYYGEMEFQMEYKSVKTEWFPWLYIDFNTLKEKANAVGLLADKIIESENNQYLAKLTLL